MVWKMEAAEGNVGGTHGRGTRWWPEQTWVSATGVAHSGRGWGWWDQGGEAGVARGQVGGHQDSQAEGPGRA